jgi:hypothetical protein
MGFNDNFAGQQTYGPHVRDGSKADIAAPPTNVRFTPKADIDPLIRPDRRQWKVCPAES